MGGCRENISDHNSHGRVILMVILMVILIVILTR